MASFKLEAIVDPRGQQKRVKIKLAKRPTLEQLKKGKILFYNNTKLDFCNYNELFTGIKKRFQKMGINNFVDFKETVRGKNTEGLRDLVKRMSREKGIVAAITALADMGTSPATTFCTIELENSGIPAVVISAPPGTDLCEQVAFYRAGHLCFCNVDIYQASTKQEIDAEIGKQMDGIIEALTLPENKIGKRAELKNKLDQVPPAEDGMLYISSVKNVSIKDEVAPGICSEEVLDLFDSLYLGDSTGAAGSN